MKRAVTVRRLDGPRQCYDAIIATVGYEERSSYIASRLADCSNALFACAFDSRKKGAYRKNLIWFQRNGFSVEERSDGRYKEWCRDVLRHLSRAEKAPVVCVDISSMSRSRMANLLEALWESRLNVEVDFLYAPAKFPGGGVVEGPIVISEPASPMFAGWSPRPEVPAVAVIGLGYEYGKAVGAVEYLEASEVWAFIGLSQEKRYEDEVRHANEDLLRLLPPGHLVEYQVENAFDCFVTLESLCAGLVRRSRPVLLPFGPKIFSICCMLAACARRPEVAVWRISTGQYEDARNRIPEGYIVGITAILEST
jgi:hypothetical protein